MLENQLKAIMGYLRRCEINIDLYTQEVNLLLSEFLKINTSALIAHNEHDSFLDKSYDKI